MLDIIDYYVVIGPCKFVGTPKLSDVLMSQIKRAFRYVIFQILFSFVWSVWVNNLTAFCRTSFLILPVSREACRPQKRSTLVLLGQSPVTSMARVRRGRSAPPKRALGAGAGPVVPTQGLPFGATLWGDPGRVGARFSASEAVPPPNPTTPGFRPLRPRPPLLMGPRVPPLTPGPPASLLGPGPPLL